MQSKKDGKYHESIYSSTTPDPGYQWESNKLLVRHHKREPRGQDNLQIYYSGASATVRSKPWLWHHGTLAFLISVLILET